MPAGARCARLLEWWGTKRLSEVTPQSCRDYVAFRAQAEVARRKAERKRPNQNEPKQVVKGAGSRRDLEDLRAAINHHAKRELHRGFIEVELPKKAQPRQHFLTRSDVARLLWACWRHGRTVRLPRGQAKGDLVESQWNDYRHLARFIILALYTASRPGAVLTASIKAGSNRSFLDLDSALFYRLAEGAQQTNKRQPPVPIPPRVLAHLRRWRDKSIINDHVVEWQGNPVLSIKGAWGNAVKLAALDKPATPHTLRHTGVTWMLQNGAEVWDVAGYAGMSEEMVRKVYGHHHPAFMKQAVTAITGKRQRF